MPQYNSSNESRREVVGLIPAAGIAMRIAPLPCSKEIYPIGFRATAEGPRPKAVCHYLLEKMRLAGITKAYVILRSGKWDVPAYFGDGALVDMHLSYLLMRLPHGAPYTLDQAYPFVQDALVALGFPDILFEPDDAFVHLLARQDVTQADVVLGLFPTNRPQTADMVDFDPSGRVRQILIKPVQTPLHYTWMIAVWTPAFTRFMHDYLADIEAARSRLGGESPIGREVFVGDVIQAGIVAGLHVESVLFASGTCLDIGIPDSLVEAVQRWGREV
jgi:glucose-1-phosphate thymidylyltransferase